MFLSDPSGNLAEDNGQEILEKSNQVSSFITEENEPTAEEISLAEEEIEVEEINENEQQYMDEEISEVSPLIPRRIPRYRYYPFFPTKRRVSGCYAGKNSGFKLELRVDVDYSNPQNKVSGDFYTTRGSTLNYWGSFVINVLSKTVTATQVKLKGTAKFTSPVAYTKIVITIPRRNWYQPQASAKLQFFSSSGIPGSTYNSSFKSRYYRTVKLEQDCETNVTPFNSYNTAANVSGGINRILTVPKAYREAGIDMVNSGTPNTISTAQSGSDAKWNNAELHNAMVSNFSQWSNNQQWKIWLFHAKKHVYGNGLYGIMFDGSDNKQRQGCASFYQGIGGNSDTKKRLQLYTNVHELGHCFNLLHSWQKSLAFPPKPNRNRSLSWMNYPWNSAFGGANGFWNNFAFKFDTQELIHLRHAFRKDIIPGGNKFRYGSSLHDNHHSHDMFMDTIEDNSKLNLSVSAKSKFKLGEPVVVEIKLSTTDLNGENVHKEIHPNFDLVKIGIEKPNGDFTVYEPPMSNCIESEIISLKSDKPAIYESAYIGYGKGGLYFDEVGKYTLKAIYQSLDGSRIVSNSISLRVSQPTSKIEEEIADLYLGEEQGLLFHLLGSDSKHLKKGNEALDTVIEKYSDNPLSVYSKLIKGVNATRNFKEIKEDKIVVRESELKKAEHLIDDVISMSSARDEGIDNISLNTAMRTLAGSQYRSGDEKSAEVLMSKMVKMFKDQGLNETVINVISEEAATVSEFER